MEIEDKRASRQGRTEEGFIPVTGGKVWYRVAGADRKAAPLLLLHGGPGARLVIFEDASHVHVLEKTPEYLGVVRDFLARTRKEDDRLS